MSNLPKNKIRGGTGKAGDKERELFSYLRRWFLLGSVSSILKGFQMKEAGENPHCWGNVGETKTELGTWCFCGKTECRGKWGSDLSPRARAVKGTIPTGPGGTGGLPCDGIQSGIIITVGGGPPCRPHRADLLPTLGSWGLGGPQTGCTPGGHEASASITHQLPN